MSDFYNIELIKILTSEIFWEIEITTNHEKNQNL